MRAVAGTALNSISTGTSGRDGCSAGTIFWYCNIYIVNLPTQYPYWYVL